MPNRALICGVSGQDGAYLACELLALGFEVWGSSRDILANPFANLVNLGIRQFVQVVSLDLVDKNAIITTLKQIRPDYIFNLSGQSSVAVSFSQPVETFESIASANFNLLDSIRLARLDTKVYLAGSTEIFGDRGNSTVNEQSPLNPDSPYAVAKASAYWTVRTYRNAYGLFACTGIVSNHESPLRPLRYVTRKVINAVARLALGEEMKLPLGNILVERDWGWAPEYVSAAILMLQKSDPEDYVIATGETNSLSDFIQTAFELVHLNWLDYVVIDEQLKRPTDAASIRLDPAKAFTQLGWKARYKMEDVVKMMLEAEINSLQTSRRQQAVLTG